MKVVFLGTPEFAVESLDAIMKSSHEVVAVVTVPDRQAGRGQRVVYSPVKQYAMEKNLPLLQPEKLRDTQFLEILSSFQADIFVVVAFRMLPEAVWGMPPYGTFNLHASLLPAYRGAAPINWAIIRGEQQTGVTTFLLNHKIDEGQILMQERTEIFPEDNAGSLHDRLSAIGSRLVVQTLDGIENRSITPMQQEGIHSMAPKIFREDCHIDFRQQGKQVVDFIRGLAPYPSATLTFRTPDGQLIPFKIFEASFHNTEFIPVGALLCDGKKSIKIGVSDGFVEILSLQMSGKKRNSTEEFLRGKNINGWKIEY